MLISFIKNCATYFILFLLYLLHFFPLCILRFCGKMLGGFLFYVVLPRKKVVLKNLELCFPSLSESQRKILAKKHFQAFACAVLDRTLGWWASPKRLTKILKLGGEGVADLENAIQQKQPIVVLAPHFIGLDAAGTILSMKYHFSSMFSNQKNEILNKVLYNGRMRFHEPVLMSRQDGLRKIVKTLKQGIPFYYLPDMDFGRKESIFVPFFGIATATTPALVRLCQMTKAKVIPCITRQIADGYEITLEKAWENFPSENADKDTLLYENTVAMNKYIESKILTMPEQYFWLHKRFKTRPEGEESFYKK